MRRELTVFVPQEMEVNRLPLGTIRIPVVATTHSADGFVTSISATALGRTQELKTRSPMTSLRLRPLRVWAGLHGSDPEAMSEISKHGAYQDLYMDLAGTQAGDGTEAPVAITVEAVIGGRRARETTRIPLRIASLPKVPGWHGGDGHVHTMWSPDVILLPIAERARYARDNGFGFIVISDHEDGIGTRWGASGGYCAQCQETEDMYGLSVLPGVEIAAAGGGHCLAYRMKESAASVPSNRSLGPRDLLWQVQSHNRPHSYGVVAHPYEKRQKWSDWSVQGLAGIEIINRSRKARPEAITQWFDLLNRDLPRTLQTGAFIVGLANSDCHNLQDPGSKGFTWIRTGGPAPSSILPTGRLDRRSVWEAIRSGRAVASGSKDLGFFTLNGAGVGDVVSAGAGSTLAFSIEHHPSGGRRCRKVTIMSSEGREVALTPGKPGLPFRYETRCPKTSTFYVIKFNFTATGRRRSSEVWTNPIFVRTA